MVSLKNFRDWQKSHPNFMTPDVIKVKQSGNRFVELSEGRSIDHKTVWGVTVVEYYPELDEFKTLHKTGLNQLFYSEVEALAHFKVV